MMYILFAFLILFVAYAAMLILFYRPKYGKEKEDNLVDIVFSVFMWGLSIFIVASLLKYFFG